MIFEFTGPQRVGKTTMMVGFLNFCLLDPQWMHREYGLRQRWNPFAKTWVDWEYKPSDVYCNFECFIPGVNCMENDEIIATMKKAKEKQWLNKIWVLDEVSQPPLFYARNSMNKEQTLLVTSVWQMPKKYTHMLYSTNIGNSADVQLRDGTYYSICPKYYGNDVRPHGPMEHDEYDYIDYDAFWIREQREQRDLQMKPPYVYAAQELFDSFKPVV